MSNRNDTSQQKDDQLLRKMFLVIEESKQQEDQAIQTLDLILKENEHPLSLQLENLDEVQHQIQSAEKRAINLGNTIQNTFKLAEGVSFKVRELHAIQERVQSAIDAVEATIGMKSCVEGVEEAIKQEDYEQATEFISKVLHSNDRKAIIINQLSSKDEQERRNFMFKKAEKKMQEILISKFTEAMKTNNLNQLQRFAKLFLPLRMEEEGLKLYGNYLSELARLELENIVHESLEKIADLPIEINIIEDEEERYSRLRKEQLHHVTFIDLVTQVLDIIVSYIENNEEFIVLNFGGKKAVIYIINILQTVCDKILKRILDYYEQKRELPEKLKYLNRIPINTNQMMSKNNNLLSFDISPTDPRVLDLLLDEISAISSMVEVYRQFIQSKALESNLLSSSITENHNNNTKQSSSFESNNSLNNNYQLNRDSQLYTKIQELMSYYIPLDESFMKQSLTKAITFYEGKNNVLKSNNGNNDGLIESEGENTSSDEEIEEGDEEDESKKYSALIYDVFFIFKKSINRAIGSLNVQIICAIANHVNTIFWSEYRDYLKKNLSLINTEPGSQKQDFINIMRMLNDFQITSEYVVKLKKEFDKLYEEKIFKNKRIEMSQDVISTERMKLKSCSSDFVQTSVQFSELLRSSMRKLISSKDYSLSLEKDINYLLDRELSQDPNFYLLTDTQFSNKEINNPFTQNFIEDIDRVLSTYQKYLIKYNFEELVDIAISLLCERIERIISLKRFNHLGGLQFDKDVRELLDYFTTKTDRTVRDKFSRLTQIACLLKLSDPNDLLEIWETAQWRLSTNEMKNILLLRVEFKQDQINNLTI
ncbi:hypothetical protein ABK040_015347 [Willaertia magna]